MFGRSRSAVDRLDVAIEAAVERHRGHPVVDRAFYAASELGDFSLIWLLLASARSLRGGRHEKAALRVAMAAPAESLFVNWFVKSFFRRTRPPWDIVRPHRIRRPTSSSFPSGHASAAAMHTVLLSEGDQLWPLYVVVAGIVASSRVYVKIHHPSDVLAGASLGLALGLLGRRVMPLPPSGG
ncbi:MAG: phosphatase PAP2 family protein [Acidimicrobiales bacterium]